MVRAGAGGQSCCLIVRSFTPWSFRLKTPWSREKPSVPRRQPTGVVSNSRWMFRSTGRFPDRAPGRLPPGDRHPGTSGRQIAESRPLWGWA